MVVILYRPFYVLIVFVAVHLELCCLHYYSNRIQCEFILYANQSDAVQRIDILSAILD